GIRMITLRRDPELELFMIIEKLPACIPAELGGDPDREAGQGGLEAEGEGLRRKQKLRREAGRQRVGHYSAWHRPHITIVLRNRVANEQIRALGAPESRAEID